MSRSNSRIVIVTLGIRIMANLPARKDGQREVDHGSQSGHFYLAESGIFCLGLTVRPSANAIGARQTQDQD
ncbi:MAG TPA: hypothetical protein VGD54_01910 [Steroidobacteraceae bacterium]